MKNRIFAAYKVTLIFKQMKKYILVIIWASGDETILTKPETDFEKMNRAKTKLEEVINHENKIKLREVA
jgi:hypothetical protein